MLIELEDFLSQLNSFRTDKKFCDVILIVDDEKFYAHRAVLAANVECFNVMFSDNFAERTNMEIPLQGISRIGFKVFLDSIYCYNLELNRASVKDALAVSLYYNAESLTDDCIDFIKKDINADNVLEYYEFADRVSCDALKSYASSFLIRNLKRITRSLDDSLEDISLITLKNFIAFSGASEVTSNALRNWFNDGKPQQQDDFNRLFEVFRNACSSSADCSEINSLMSIKKNIYVFTKVINKHQVAITPWFYDGSSIKYQPQMELKVYDKMAVPPVSHDGKAYLYARQIGDGDFHYYCTTKEQWISGNSQLPTSPVHQLASSDFDNSIYLNFAEFDSHSSHVPDADIYYYKVDLDKCFRSKISGYATADNEKIFHASLVSYRNCIFSCGGRSVNRSTLNDTLMLDIRANQWIRKCDTPMFSFDNWFNPTAVLNDRLYLCNCQNLYMYDIRANKWLKFAKKSNFKIKYLIQYQNTLHGLDKNCGHFNIYDPVSDGWKMGSPFGRNLDDCCGALVV